MWGGGGEELLRAQDTSRSGQFPHQLTLHITVREASLKEVPNSEFRRLLAYGKSFNCAGAHVGDSMRATNRTAMELRATNVKLRINSVLWFL